jgi:hypothetical protein
MSPVMYQLGFYTPEDDILHAHRGEASILTKDEIHYLLFP